MRHKTVVLDTPEAIERHLGLDIEPAGFDDPAVRFVLCDRANQVLAHCHVRALPAELRFGDQVTAAVRATGAAEVWLDEGAFAVRFRRTAGGSEGHILSLIHI